MKRFFIIIFSLAIVGSLSYSAVLANSMYEQYNDTVKWENSSLLSNIHQVPPPLAQNYISSEEQKVFQLLTDVNVALEEIIKEGEVNDKKRNEYWELHDKVKAEIEKSSMYEVLTVKSMFNDFSLYLEVDSAIREAYVTLSTEGLEEHAKTLYNRLSKEDNEIERSFLNKLNEISNDFKRLNDFSESAISKLGFVENDVLHVGATVNKAITDGLLEEIETGKLTRFSHIKDLVEILNGDSWKKILAHNSISSEYYSWKESQEILEALTKSSYISVSSFKTIQDIISYNPSISLEEKEGFTINTDSVVTGVFYDDEKLSEDLYIKRGASLYFTIDYEYTEKPKSTVTVQYLDTDGNKIVNVDEKTYEHYVGYPLSIDRKAIPGYTFVEIKNILSEFPESDSIIKVIYKKNEPIIEDENEDLEEEIDEGDESSDNNEEEVNEDS